MEDNNNDQPQSEEKINETLVKENIEQSNDEKQSSEENVQEPSEEKPVVVQPVEEKVEEQPVEEKVEEQPVVEQPVEEQKVEEQQVEEQQVEEQSVEEQSVEEQPVIEQPVIEQPVVEQPVVEQPVVEQPVEENINLNNILTSIVEESSSVETSSKESSEDRLESKSEESIDEKLLNIKEPFDEKSSKNSSFTTVNLKGGEYYPLNEKVPELYNSVKELLNSDDFSSDFIKIVPMLMLKVNIYNFSLSGEEKKNLVIDFLITMLEDSENDLYKSIKLEDSTRKLLTYVCPNMIDICYNISKHGLKKDFPNYDNRVILDEEKLLSHVIENVSDYNFENNDLSKKEFMVKFFGLLFAMISFVEMANVQNIDIKLFVIKAGKDFLKEKNFDDSEFYNYFDMIVYVLFNVLNGSLSIIQNSNIKCNCNCFSFFFSK